MSSPSLVSPFTTLCNGSKIKSKKKKKKSAFIWTMSLYAAGNKDQYTLISHSVMTTHPILIRSPFLPLKRPWPIETWTPVGITRGWQILWEHVTSVFRVLLVTCSQCCSPCPLSLWQQYREKFPVLAVTFWKLLASSRLCPHGHVIHTQSSNICADVQMPL